MRSYQMTALFGYFGVPGPDFLLRDYGRRAFPVLEQQLGETRPGEALCLDFTGVSVMDTSFGDEAVLELALGLVDDRYGDRFLILHEPSPATVENMEGTIARRKAKVAILVKRDGQLGLIGEVEPNLLDAWRRVSSAGTLTARQLADELGLEINTASMRLHKLYRLRLVAREEEVSASGRQHIYRVPS